MLGAFLTSPTSDRAEAQSEDMQPMSKRTSGQPILEAASTKACALLLSLLLALAGSPAWAEDEAAPAPDRRREIDARIEALDARREEISTEGPMTATVLGLAMLVGGAVAMGVGARPCTDEFNECPPPVGAFAAGAALLCFGGITALAGGVIWSERVDRRNEIDAERESLIEERDGLAAALSRVQLYSEVRDKTHFVTLGLRF